jgi:hypothetical protein
MTSYKIQTLQSLREEMKAVARGERPAPADAAKPSFNSVDAKLEAAGFITMKSVGRRKAPSAAIKKLVVEIDPFSENDRLRVA